MTAIDVANAIRSQNLEAAVGQVGQPPVPRGQAFQLPIDTLGRLIDPEQFGDIIVKVGRRPPPRRPAGSRRRPRAAPAGLGLADRPGRREPGRRAARRPRTTSPDRVPRRDLANSGHGITVSNPPMGRLRSRAAWSRASRRTPLHPAGHRRRSASSRRRDDRRRRARRRGGGVHDRRAAASGSATATSASAGARRDDRTAASAAGRSAASPASGIARAGAGDGGRTPGRGRGGPRPASSASATWPASSWAPRTTTRPAPSTASPSVGLAVYQLPGTNALDVADRVRQQDGGAEGTLPRRRGLRDRLRHHAVHPRVGRGRRPDPARGGGPGRRSSCWSSCRTGGRCSSR